MKLARNEIAVCGVPDSQGSKVGWSIREITDVYLKVRFLRAKAADPIKTASLPSRSCYNGKTFRVRIERGNEGRRWNVNSLLSLLS